MPLFINDDRIAELVAELAVRRGVSKQDAVKLACAKASGARLLYKGGDFAKTDLA